MERYELANGKVYEISRWSDTCTVAHKGKVVYTGSYAGCRKYINNQKWEREDKGHGTDYSVSSKNTGSQQWL